MYTIFFFTCKQAQAYESNTTLKCQFTKRQFLKQFKALILTISLGQLGLKTGQKLQTIKKIQNPKT
jgi:hypothetical protein